MAVLWSIILLSPGYGKEINKLSEKFKAGRTDAMLVNLDTTHEN